MILQTKKRTAAQVAKRPRSVSQHRSLGRRRQNLSKNHCLDFEFQFEFVERDFSDNDLCSFDFVGK